MHVRMGYVDVDGWWWFEVDVEEDVEWCRGELRIGGWEWGGM